MARNLREKYSRSLAGEEYTGGKHDPMQPPWPLLHEKISKMREGKIPLDALGKLWEQAHYYHPGDWLIPLEITQILKYTSIIALQDFISDIDLMKEELIEQLESIRSGTVKTVDPITFEVRELIGSTINDLNQLDLQSNEIPLIPTATR